MVIHPCRSTKQKLRPQSLVGFAPRTRASGADHPPPGGGRKSETSETEMLHERTSRLTRSETSAWRRLAPPSRDTPAPRGRRVSSTCPVPPRDRRRPPQQAGQRPVVER